VAVSAPYRTRNEGATFEHGVLCDQASRGAATIRLSATALWEDTNDRFSAVQGIGALPRSCVHLRCRKTPIRPPRGQIDRIGGNSADHR
jgi:hypothetical protein